MRRLMGPTNRYAMLDQQCLNADRRPDGRRDADVYGDVQPLYGVRT